MGLQHLELRPVVWLEPGALESSIPANASAIAVCIYFSFYPLIIWPGLIPSEHSFRRYLLAYALTILVSLAVFAFVPSGVSRESIDLDEASWLYQQLAGLDQPRNAFPSLHASLSVLAGLTICTAVQAGIVRTLVVLWIAIIFWSTIATRQHVVVDLVSGGALAVVAWLLARRVIRES